MVGQAVAAILVGLAVGAPVGPAGASTGATRAKNGGPHDRRRARTAGQDTVLAARDEPAEVDMGFEPTAKQLMPELTPPEELALLARALWREGYDDHLAGHITISRGDGTLWCSPWLLQVVVPVVPRKKQRIDINVPGAEVAAFDIGIGNHESVTGSGAQNPE